MTFQSSFLQTLAERGYIHQQTDADGLDEACKSPITAYIGFDCTADSLHIGSLLPIMLLRRLQQAGHTPIILMGGGTTRIGDPSGKDSARQLLTDEQIASNKQRIQGVFSQYLSFTGKNAAIMVDNADWLLQLNYLNFLRDFGSHFTINRMLTFDSVKLRLEREQPLTFLEFNYMILQAFDFYHLAQHHGCVLQMGGSDQWGNIVNGVDLTRRVLGKQVFGLTVPLLTTATGQKMGKSEKGAVWLNADKLSPYDFWQYWRNIEDADVGRFLRLFTDIPLEEITVLESRDGAAINESKKVLATAVTTLCHGAEQALRACETAEKSFSSGGGLGADLPSITLTQPTPIIDIIVQLSFADSKGDAKRLIAGNGVRLDNVVVTDAGLIVTATGTPQRLSVGKKKIGVIV